MRELVVENAGKDSCTVFLYIFSKPLSNYLNLSGLIFILYPCISAENMI